jgi:hypothetical protein
MARSMIYRTALLGSALATAAASPPRYPPFAMADPLPLSVFSTPSPVAATGAAIRGFAPAPVPDIDKDGGALHKAGPAKVELTPNLFHQRQTYQGDGYTPYSTVQGEQTKKIRPAPGFNVSVPLE